MDEVAIKILDGLFQKCIVAFFEPIKNLFGVFAATPDVLSQFAFINILYTKMQVIALALIILIATWQSFKASFAFLGFECEEPWRIGGRVISFTFLMFFSKELIYIVLAIFKSFVDFIWGAFGMVEPSAEQFRNLIIGLLTPGVNIVLFSWSAIVFIYLIYKFIKLAFKFGERLMLTVVLLIVSPLAFASGVSQVTKGFLQGWLKLFVGNLMVQLIQISIVIAMILYRATDKDMASVFSFVIIVSMIKVLEKLEDVVRDAAMNVGIGRDVSSAISKISNILQTANQASQVMNTVKTLITKKQ